MNNGVGDMFFDDNIWVARNMLFAYEIFGNDDYLSEAIKVTNFIYTGWNEEIGGLVWNENGLGTNATPQELERGLSSLYAIKTVGLDEQATALNKLKTVFGSDNADWIEVDFGFWSDGEKESAIFQELKSAIIEKKEICFQYTSMQEEAMARTVEPLKLIFKGASWYLYAFCKAREDYRFFKLKRIQGLNVLESSFIRKAPERVLDDNTYIEKGNLILVKLKINQQLAYRVYDDFKNYTKLSD